MKLTVELAPEACNALAIKFALEAISRHLVELYGYRPLSKDFAGQPGMTGQITSGGDPVGTWRLE